ncbi:MAG: glycerophosphodiester phosphodiesterase family protein [Clostridia bacterium]|nr:glycerophosphodiester phosphodiesterase family protein [Clostridia bacterium]
MRTEELLKNIVAFVPAWSGEWQPDARMLDFEEKWEAFHTPGGRLMSCAHRGDRNEIYPENSIEGFLSVILAGADILEVDIHTTRDSELVIMHDDTLTRTTNISMLRESGESWMPESDEIHAWTLEEIRRLRLITAQGELT